MKKKIDFAKSMPTDKVMSSTSINDLAHEIKKCIIAKRKQHTEPLSWEFAQKCYKVQCFPIYRRWDVDRQYQISGGKMRSKWDDINSLIKHEVFGMEYSFDKTARRRTVKDPIKGN